jgi:hypothetical protein
MPTINSGFDNNSPQAIEKAIGKIQGGRTVPYSSVSEALIGIPAAFRFIGKSCMIDNGVTQAEYWFYKGISDDDLLLKTASGGGLDEFFVD